MLLPSLPKDCVYRCTTPLLDLCDAEAQRQDFIVCASQLLYQLYYTPSPLFVTKPMILCC